MYIGEYKLGEEVTLKFPDDPADTYFSVAFRRMKECGRGPKGCESTYRRQDILSSCICSFLSLESAINRLFYEAFVRSDEGKRSIKQGIPRSLVTNIQQSWRRTSVRDKFILLPPLISDYEFDVTAIPFSLFNEFIQFRNRLVHPKMLETIFVVKVTEVKEGSLEAEEVVGQPSGAPTPKQVFPLTNFSTSFDKLVVDDAEKAFEIAYRMRMELHAKVFAPPPLLLYEFIPETMQIKIGAGIDETIKLQFEPPPKKKEHQSHGG